ncbi:protein serine/threonine kinase, putative [Entamoeba invadens IP1]|uniref:Protein serine/threonine kinase, putative n=1 Tax=Entamoeba invadens IP1 TaxID=370355 RepID=A0A0A1U708_ENTIV|nr:protein serine/threonine kinase, putative [Entamoeba invadens IP1]ELP90172.1 protein serine/threonine kinase, putative [Entamoeba invadens IP1]|eukprot:XP_004256943.1 protein serine/threonine kinase, putative [Entamoeba invadens IP1]
MVLWLFLWIATLVSSETYCDTNDRSIILESQSSCAYTHGWSFGTYDAQKAKYTALNIPEYDVCFGDTPCDNFLFSDSGTQQCVEEITIQNPTWDGHKMLVIAPNSSLKKLTINQKAASKWYIHSLSTQNVTVVFNTCSGCNPQAVVLCSDNTLIYQSASTSGIVDLKFKSFPPNMLIVGGGTRVSYSQYNSKAVQQLPLFVGKKGIQLGSFCDNCKEPKSVCTMGDFKRYSETSQTTSNCQCTLTDNNKYNVADCLMFSSYFALTVNIDNMKVNGFWNSLKIGSNVNTIQSLGNFGVKNWITMDITITGNFNANQLTCSAQTHFDNLTVETIEGIVNNKILFFTKSANALPDTVKLLKCSNDGYNRVVGLEYGNLCQCTPKSYPDMIPFVESDCNDLENKDLVLTNNVNINENIKVNGIYFNNSLNISITSEFVLEANTFNCDQRIFVFGKTKITTLNIKQGCELILDAIPELKNVEVTSTEQVVFIGPYSDNLPDGIEIGCDVNKNEVRYVVKGSIVGCYCTIKEGSVDDSQLNQWDCTDLSSSKTLLVTTSQSMTINKRWRNVICRETCFLTFTTIVEDQVVVLQDAELSNGEFNILNVTQNNSHIKTNECVINELVAEHGFFYTSTGQTIPSNTFALCDISPYRVSNDKLNITCNCHVIGDSFDLWDCNDYSQYRTLIVDSDISNQHSWNILKTTTGVTINSSGCEIQQLEVTSDLRFNGKDSETIVINKIVFPEVIPQIYFIGNITVYNADINEIPQDQILFLSTNKQEYTIFISSCFVDGFYRNSMTNIGCNCYLNENGFEQWDCVTRSSVLTLVLTQDIVYTNTVTIWNALLTTQQVKLITPKKLVFQLFKAEYGIEVDGELSIMSVVIQTPDLILFDVVSIDSVTPFGPNSDVLFVAKNFSGSAKVLKTCEGEYSRFSPIDNKIGCYCTSEYNNDSFSQNDCDTFSTERILKITSNDFQLSQIRSFKQLEVTNSQTTVVNGADLYIEEYTHVYPVIFKNVIKMGILHFEKLNGKTAFLQFYNPINITTINTTNVDQSDLLFVGPKEFDMKRVKSSSIEVVCDDGNTSRYGVVNSQIGCLCSAHTIGEEADYDVSDCAFFDTTKNRDFVVNGIVSITKETHWRDMYIQSTESAVNGNSQISFVTCNFSDITIDIRVAQFECSYGVLFHNSQITLSGILTVDKMSFQGSGNLDKNVLIEVLNGGVNMSDFIAENLDDCVDLLGSNSSINSTIQTTSNYEVLNINNKQLVRVCQMNNSVTTATCVVSSEKLSEARYEMVYCPCVDIDCFYQVGKKIDLECTPIQMKTKEPEIEVLEVGEVTFGGSSGIIVDSVCSQNILKFDKLKFLKTYTLLNALNLDGNYIELLSLQSDIKITSDMTINTTEYNSKPITISSFVNEITFNWITSHDNYTESVLKTEESVTPLTIQFGEEIDHTTYPTLFVRNVGRQIISTHSFTCGNQAIILGQNDTNDVCEYFGLSHQKCVAVNNEVYNTENGQRDFSCPCLVENFDCVIKITEDYVSTTFDMCNTTPSRVEIWKGLIVNGLKNKVVALDIKQGDTTFYLVDSMVYLSFNNNSLIMFSAMNSLLVSTTPLIFTRMATNSIQRKYTQNETWFSVQQGGSCEYASVSTSVECLMCARKYYLKEGNCYESQKMPNCLSTVNSECYNCENGFYLVNESCLKCIEIFPDCQSCNQYECLACQNNTWLNENNTCVDDTSFANCEVQGGVCQKCNDAFWFDFTTQKCEECSSGCAKCTNLTVCESCSIGYQKDENLCILSPNSSEVVWCNVISCEYGFYVVNSTSNDTESAFLSSEGPNSICGQTHCVSCAHLTPNCKYCDTASCYLCEEDFVLQDSQCVNKSVTHCKDIQIEENTTTIENSKCKECDNYYYLNDLGQCTQCAKGCLVCQNSTVCDRCDSKHIKSGNKCEKYNNTTLININCKEVKIGMCTQCVDDYYFLPNSNTCSKCETPNCAMCVNNTCYNCETGYFINDFNECISSNNSNCKIPFLNDIGCVECDDGFYQKEIKCYNCSEQYPNCLSCVENNCLQCGDDYFVNEGGRCESVDALLHCVTIDYYHGCSECENGYTLSRYKCVPCASHCNLCSQIDCQLCEENYVKMNNNTCIYYQSIPHCEESNGVICVSCSTLYKSADTSCRLNVVSIFFLSVFCIILLLALLIGSAVLISYNVIKKKKPIGSGYVNIDSGITTFPMKYSTIKFINLNPSSSVLFDKRSLLFEGGLENIGVNVESRTLFCIANPSRKKVFVTITCIETKYPKFQMRFEPSTVCIPEHQACEIEVFVKPLCSSHVSDYVVVLSQELQKKESTTDVIPFNYTTKLSTRIDPDELLCLRKIGEGGFGVVYYGSFHGNEVAIKKMKQMEGVGNSQCEIDEFEAEVSMLDKFRSENIVFFYGAVFIPDKICMVTEYAKYGSLRNLMKSKSEIVFDLKLKILKDSTKGIQYLHRNGIVHRDIKPDNILIFSLDSNVVVNAKLTDFGSSRNINMLKANMTFTNSKGSPAYMAPEVLNQERYGSPVDIFAFGIVMYEVWTWKTAYANDDFKYLWKIADFICDGKRLMKPSTMPEWYYIIVNKCWQTNPLDRMSIEEVIEMLDFGMNAFL